MNYKLKNLIRKLSNKINILNIIYIKMNSIKVNYYSKLNDEDYAKLKYKENTGKELNIDNPKTFNEKIWWLKLNNKDPLMTICSDKYRVREYVKNKGLKHILNPLLGVYDKVEEIKFEELPDKAFIKMNNVSGINVLWDRKNETNSNPKKIIKKFNKNRNFNYFLQSREYNYKNIPPKIVVEKFLEDESELGLVDYRLLCFGGEMKLIFVDIDVASSDGSHNPESKRNIYDKNFILQSNVKAKRENFDPSLLPKPKNFDKMIEYAEKLSEHFEFCRVDFYNLNGKIIFGEMTFYTGGGTQLITPEEWEFKLGDWIDLTSSKIVIKQ